MIRLFVNWFRTEAPLRNEEYEHCLELNLNNDLIDWVVILTEFRFLLSTKFLIHPKIIILERPRPTYSDFFEEINSFESDISIIANSDIAFNDTLSFINALKPEVALCLTRWDMVISGDVVTLGKFELRNHPQQTQDTWCFRGPIKPVEGNFYLGVPGCDNKIAHCLKEAGYTIRNPCKLIKTFHFHDSNIRTYTRKDRVEPPYLMVPPTQTF